MLAYFAFPWVMAWKRRVSCSSKSRLQAVVAKGCWDEKDDMKGVSLSDGAGGRGGKQEALVRQPEA